MARELRLLEQRGEPGRGGGARREPLQRAAKVLERGLRRPPRQPVLRERALESESDPRQAVIKAYAGMERALAEDGLPRQPSETPLEYLRRALERLSASTAATTRLTSLFEQAKFSSHAIDEPMRREALAALGELRSELAQ